jgi:hypothetical protein
LSTEADLIAVLFVGSVIHLFDDFPQQIVLLLPQGDKFIDPGIDQKEKTYQYG